MYFKHNVQNSEGSVN